jgi:dipeptidyl aminopeptidase/acylaminoacyl peptidase
MGAVKSVKRILRSVAWIVAVIFIMLNVLAYHHAGSFFFYSESGERTPAPENLTWRQKFSVLINGIHVPKPRKHSSPDSVGLRYENVQVPGRDGMMLAGWIIPAAMPGKTAVLFHGYSSEKSGILPEAVRFSEMGYQVLMVDFPGSGDSPGNMTSLGILEADDVASVYEWARTTWPDDRIVLYGHSMGGAAVMRSMAQNGVKPDAAIVEAVFDTLLNAIRYRFHLLHAPSFPAAEILLFWGSFQLGANGFTHDVVQYAESIDSPVMIIHGKNDNRASWSRARLVYEALNGRTSFLLIEGAGHVNPCLSDPEKWRQAVASFLDETWSEMP